jgi:hypothetical protein
MGTVVGAWRDAFRVDGWMYRQEAIDVKGRKEGSASGGKAVDIPVIFFLSFFFWESFW